MASGRVMGFQEGHISLSDVMRGLKVEVPGNFCKTEVKFSAILIQKFIIKQLKNSNFIKFTVVNCTITHGLQVGLLY